MCSAFRFTLLSFVTQAYAKEVVAHHAASSQDSMDDVVDNLVDKVTEKSPKVATWAGMDETKFQQVLEDAGAPKTETKDEGSPLLAGVKRGIKSIVKFFTTSSKAAKVSTEGNGMEAPTEAAPDTLKSPKGKGKGKGKEQRKTFLEKLDEVAKTPTKEEEVKDSPKAAGAAAKAAVKAIGAAAKAKVVAKAMKTPMKAMKKATPMKGTPRKATPMKAMKKPSSALFVCTSIDVMGIAAIGLFIGSGITFHLLRFRVESSLEVLLIQ